MQLQYLVALCCAHINPSSSDVIIGDKIIDDSIDDKRDVDITLSFTDKEGVKYAMSAFEVKKEKRPLSVDKVGELCDKLNSMSSITHKGIVSASSYSNKAKKKAWHNGIDLFRLKSMPKNFKKHFPALAKVGVDPTTFFNNITIKGLLCWFNYKTTLHLDSLVTANQQTTVFLKPGIKNSKFPNLAKVENEALLRSTIKLFEKPEMKELEKKVPYSDYVDLTADSFYIVNSDNKLVQVLGFTIDGYLGYEDRQVGAEHYILENVKTGLAYAGVSVILYPDREQFASFIMNPDSTAIKVNPPFKLSDSLKNMITNYKLLEEIKKTNGNSIQMSYRYK